MKLMLKGLKLAKRYKTTLKSLQFSYAALPSCVRLSMHQHNGTSAVPVVEVGQTVKENEIIGMARSHDSVNVHSPVPGTVKSVYETVLANGAVASVVEIETGGQFSKRKEKTFVPFSRSAEHMLQSLKELGVVDLGERCRPLHQKLDLKGKKIEYFIINCFEYEPYSAVMGVLLKTRQEELATAIKSVAESLHAEKVVLYVPEEMQYEAESLKSLISGENERDNSAVSLMAVADKYPIARENIIAEIVSGRHLTYEAEAVDYGCLILNLNTLNAFYNAVFFAEPYTRQIISIAGDALAEPKVVMAVVGTTLRFLFEECGGLRKKVERVIMGGPMTGYAVADLDTPLTKDVYMVLALTRKEVTSSHSTACSNCNRCMEVCPRRLVPHQIYKAVVADRYDYAENLAVKGCIECGCCAYVCPARLNLSQAFGVAKKKLKAMPVNEVG
jgi:electron transport complex protein RnfC